MSDFPELGDFIRGSHSFEQDRWAAKIVDMDYDDDRDDFILHVEGITTGGFPGDFKHLFLASSHGIRWKYLKEE